MYLFKKQSVEAGEYRSAIKDQKSKRDFYVTIKLGNKVFGSMAL